MNWRETGDCSFAEWSALLPIASRIRQDGEMQACYDAAKGLTRLCLGMLKAESSFAVAFNADPPSNKNALNLRPRGGGQGFMSFPSWATGVAEWKSRLLDATYAYKDTQTIADLVHVYAPAADNNNEQQYAATVEGVIAALTPTSQATGGVSTMALNMARDLIPLPPFQTRIVTDAQNNKWDNLGPRVVKGFVLHRMLGTLDGTDAYFRRGTASTGLTDWGSDNASGTVYLWNSPEGFAGNGASANRSPWASGVFNVNGDAYGDGLAFVNKYGINAVNQLETAWEIAGGYNDPWSDASQQAAAQACAHYAHNYGIQWDQFPIHPQDGFSFVRWHQEITGPKEKICPGPVVMNATDAWIERVRGILKAAQTGATVPAPNPTPAPAVVYPPLMDKGVAADLFGSKAAGGVTYAYSEGQPLSTLWLENGKATGQYPSLANVKQYKDSATVTRTIWIFSNGLAIGRPNDAAPVAILKG